MNTLMNGIINTLLEEGISITLLKENGVIKYDLNTGMKSHLIISESSFGLIKCEGRYDHVAFVESYMELLREVKNCMQGQDYLNFYWEKLLSKEGLLKKTITTQVSYA